MTESIFSRVLGRDIRRVWMDGREVWSDPRCLRSLGEGCLLFGAGCTAAVRISYLACTWTMVEILVAETKLACMIEHVGNDVRATEV